MEQDAAQATVGDVSEQATYISSCEELETFSNSSDRKISDALKGVLAETALTGRIRYRWTLLRPLVEQLVENVLLEYDAASANEVGPSRFAAYGESIIQTIDRLKGYLSSFNDAPWTLQRLCELLLAPQKQYKTTHKLAMAIEKCLLVTSEIPVTLNSPHPPTLNELGPVNENPPKPGTGTRSDASVDNPSMFPATTSRSHNNDDAPLGTGLAAAVLEVKQQPTSMTASFDEKNADASNGIVGSLETVVPERNCAMAEENMREGDSLEDTSAPATKRNCVEIVGVIHSDQVVLDYSDVRKLTALPATETLACSEPMQIS